MQLHARLVGVEGLVVSLQIRVPVSCPLPPAIADPPPRPQVDLKKDLLDARRRIKNEPAQAEAPLDSWKHFLIEKQTKKKASVAQEL